MKDKNICVIMDTLAEIIEGKDIKIRYLEYEVKRLEEELKEAKSHE